MADPYPHTVIDDFLPAEVYQRVSADFPTPEADIWHQYRGSRENKKLQSRDRERLPHACREVIDQLNSPAFIRELEALTGFAKLIADPDLTGGGLHQTLPGGHLAVHVDYNRHRVTGHHRRLNVILYLNDEWEDAWGGHLELWDEGMTRCAKRIAPLGNRLAIFTTSETSWHGHPEPLACPRGVTRRSIALYYYTSDAAEVADSHSTVFRERPGEQFRKTLRERASGLIAAMR